MYWEQNLTQEQLGERVGVKKAQLVKRDGLANTATDFLLRRYVHARVGNGGMKYM